MARRRFSKRDLEKRLREVFGGRCAWCKCAIDGRSGLEWDHALPISMGGEDALDNLQPLCARDHRLKTGQEAGPRAKSDRQRHRHIGIKATRNPLPCGRRSPWKKKFNGEVVPR